MSKIAATVKNLVESEIEKMNIDLIDVEYVKEGSRKYLRVYIDKRGGVTIDDCEMVAKAIGPMIDELDPIQESYVFEVSSPGIDRPLKTEKDFKRYEGHLVEVRLYTQVEGRKTYEGYLDGLYGDVLKITDEKSNVLEFDMKNVSIVKRAIKFD
jgi:ribosome maturation factor RimP